MHVHHYNYWKLASVLYHLLNQWTRHIKIITPRLEQLYSMFYLLYTKFMYKQSSNSRKTNQILQSYIGYYNHKQTARVNVKYPISALLC